MPLYDYSCAQCGDFAAMRPMARWRDPAPCPECGAAAHRIVAGAPALGALSSAVRRAHAMNERNASEPRSTRGGHGMNCGCCGGTARSGGKTRRTADGGKTFADSRPWMIGH
ncbi:zinc ribbon domain-containing protein [Bordetella bronchialis]|uniref:FmdB family transcriptional regulator n=1 Tax=Bordetella bronchialis TaxID=463025 RepID=A0ABN4R2A8_9BORD|nr:zinc ribbon domain-containing protein [Bordetella bronchialis]ANN65501.1 FmdB family transcriptional regulator [Bordetella bronchialis]